MKEKENKRFRNIIVIGNAFATLEVGFSARVVVYFERLPKGKKPPKHAVAVLLYLCGWTQKKNGYNESEKDVIGVEVSARELANEIGAQNPKTIYNGLEWLERNNWITQEKGSNQTQKTVVTVNVEKVNQFATTGEGKEKPPNYDYQLQEWENILKRLGK